MTPILGFIWSSMECFRTCHGSLTLRLYAWGPFKDPLAEYETGFILLLLVSSFLILVSVYTWCPFGGTRNIYPTSYEGHIWIKRREPPRGTAARSNFDSMRFGWRLKKPSLLFICSISLIIMLAYKRPQLTNDALGPCSKIVESLHSAAAVKFVATLVAQTFQRKYLDPCGDTYDRFGCQ